MNSPTASVPPVRRSSSSRMCASPEVWASNGRCSSTTRPATRWSSRRSPTSRRSSRCELPVSVAVDARRRDEHGDASLLHHRAVVRVPVVVLTAGGNEDVAQDDAQPFGVDVWVYVVRPDQLGAALDGGP